MAFLNQTRIRTSSLSISILLVLSGVLFYYYRLFPFLDFIELKSIDIRFLSRGEKAPEPRVALAVIDEKSLEAEGKWPWPRIKMAALIRKLSDGGASVIALDVGFFEPDRPDAGEVIDEIKETARTLSIQHADFIRFLDEIKKQRDYDRILADTIHHSGAKVVLGYYFNQDIRMPAESGETTAKNHTRNIKGSLYIADRYIPADPRNPLPAAIPLTASGYPESNIEVISKSTSYSGFFNAESDIDGNLRWIPALIEYDGKRYAPLALMAFSAFTGAPPSLEWTDYGIQAITIGDREIPVSADGKIRINFRGKQGAFPYYSATDILNGQIPSDLLKGKIIVVGATATGLHDIRMTPFDRMPGPEIHATLIDNILSGNFLYYPSGYELFSVIAIVLSGLLMGIFLPFLGGRAGLILFLTMGAGYVFTAQALFNGIGLILNLVYPLLVATLTYIAITAYQYVALEKKRRFIQNAFSTYLSPKVVNELIQSPEKLNLGGEELHITAFFSDIQGFSTISESLGPKELVLLLNEYLSEMEAIVQIHSGIVDKYEGDAIIAIFGAPYQTPLHAENGCLAAIDMQNRLESLREKWKAQNRPVLKMRIGMATGPAIVGNMGSKKKMNYTMMGDTVNTAARLEGVNKVYGTYSMISQTTYEAVKERIIAREIDSVIVVGKKRPVRIYQPLCRREHGNEQMAEMIRLYETGLSFYRNREWDKAIHHFEEVLKRDPEDGPSQVMTGRCRLFQTAPPPETWDQAFSMASK